MSFLKPGSQSSGAFGLSFGRDGDQNGHKKRKEEHPFSGTAAGSGLIGSSRRGREPSSRPGGDRHRDEQQQQQQQLPPLTGPRAHLPVAAHRLQILYLLEKHSTLILLGETGSGKSTQVPQYLAEAGWAAGDYQIACTQPRRVAAVTLAQRVAEEMGTEVGVAVGYAVRFDREETKGSTKIKFLTDGTLIREMMDDPLLTSYSVVLLDEAHERSLATDLLMGLLKKVQRQRPGLRLIVSSATLEAERLRDFFDASGGGGPGGSGSATVAAAVAAGQRPDPRPAVLSLEGRMYPVQLHYREAPCPDYVRSAVEAVAEIHRQGDPGDMLVFLTGQQEVEAAVAMIEEEARRMPHGLPLKLMALPLYAGLPGAQQRAVFEPTPRNWRKVVVATNIAETSLTLDGVVFVVDSCFVKQRAYNPLLGLDALLVAPTSKASAVQRAGRAGRVRPGQCFRLCTKEDYEKLLPATSVPEVQRSDLTAMVLQLKALGIDNVMRFAWLSPPPAEAMVRALEALHALGALDSDARLTREVGLPLASLPLEPALGKCLLSSCHPDLACAEEMLTVASLLSVPHVFHAAPGSARAAEEARAKFAAVEGDFVTLLNVARAWREHGRSSQWASRHHLNQFALVKAEGVRQQLELGLKHVGLRVESCDGDMDKVRRAAASGLFLNAAVFDHVHYEPLAPEGDPGRNAYRLARTPAGSGQGLPPLKLRVHPSSVLFRARPTWVVYHSCQQTDNGWFEMQGVTPVEAAWVAEAAPHVYASVTPGARTMGLG